MPFGFLDASPLAPAAKNRDEGPGAAVRSQATGDVHACRAVSP